MGKSTVAIAALAIAAVALVLFWTVHQTVSLLKQDAITECQRVQSVRSDLNGVKHILHDVFQAGGKYSLKYEKHHRTTSLQRHWAGLYLQYANKLLDSPPTDCTAAINDGSLYQRPPDRPFRPVR